MDWTVSLVDRMQSLKRKIERDQDIVTLLHLPIHLHYWFLSLLSSSSSPSSGSLPYALVVETYKTF